MKVLHVINSLNIGGAERLLVDIIPLLKNSNLEVDVLILCGDETPFYRELHIKGVNIINLKSKSIYSLNNVFKLRSYIKKYDVVHSHLFPSQYWVVLSTIFVRRKIRLITTEHNTTNRRRKNVVFYIFDLFVYHKYNKIICITPETQNNLVKYIKSIDSKVITIYNGVDINKYENSKPYIKEQINVQNDSVLILQVAAFRPQKDQDTLIRSLLYLPHNYNVILVGDGERRVDLLDLCDSLNLKERVIFLGLRNDVGNIMKTCDIVVLSSHYEGFGLSAVEGMASMKPVIVSNVEGMAQIVDGAGLLFEKGDSKQLANYILKLMSDRVFYDSISSLCFNRSKQFDIKLMVEKLISLYR